MWKEITGNPGLKNILIGALGNLILSVLKILGGVLGRSAAMVADGVHSLSDLLTDGVVLLSHRIGQMPADENHPYGHGRAETIGATLIGTVIILAGFSLAYEAWNTIMKDTGRVPTVFAAITAVISIAVKEGLYRYTRAVGKQVNSPSLIANAWHHRSDAVSSLAALAGILGAMNGYPIMDPLAAGLVAIMIVHVGYKIVAGGVRDLMDTGLSEETIRKMESAILQVPGVIRCHDLRTRRIGGEVLVDVHIQVDKDASVTEGHHIGEMVRRALIRGFKNIQDVLVHVDGEDDSDFHPLYWISRQELQTQVDAILAATPGVRTRTLLRNHYHGGKIILEIAVRLEPELSREREKEIVEGLKSRLIELDHVDEVRVFLDTD